jgi:nitroreductase
LTDTHPGLDSASNAEDVDEHSRPPAIQAVDEGEIDVDVVEAMTTTGTCREFRDEPVPDDVLLSAMEAARFAPQGGNRQGVRLVVIRDMATRRVLGDLYLARWKPYWAGIIGAQGSQVQDRQLARVDEFAKNLHRVPVLAVVCAELAALHPTDQDLGRLSVVGGASIYPLVQNFCLALRDLGVATAMTTLLCHEESAVKALLDISDDVITAGHIAIGYPAHPFPSKLKRMAATDLMFGERYGCPLGTA